MVQNRFSIDLFIFFIYLDVRIRVKDNLRLVLLMWFEYHEKDVR